MTVKPTTPNRDVRLALISFFLGLIVASSLLFVFGAPRVLPQSFLASRSLKPTSPARVNASMYGAVIATTSGEVACEAERIVFTLTSGAPYQTQMVLTTGRQFIPDAGHVYTLGGSLARLTVTLIDDTGAPYRTFTATEGSAELVAGRGLLSGILYDEVGEQLLASASWTCPQ